MKKIKYSELSRMQRPRGEGRERGERLRRQKTGGRKGRRGVERQRQTENQAERGRAGSLPCVALGE